MHGLKVLKEVFVVPAIVVMAVVVTEVGVTAVVFAAVVIAEVVIVAVVVTAFVVAAVGVAGVVVAGTAVAGTAVAGTGPAIKTFLRNRLKTKESTFAWTKTISFILDCCQIDITEHQYHRRIRLNSLLTY